MGRGGPQVGRGGVWEQERDRRSLKQTLDDHHLAVSSPDSPRACSARRVRNVSGVREMLRGSSAVLGLALCLRAGFLFRNAGMRLRLLFFASLGVFSYLLPRSSDLRALLSICLCLCVCLCLRLRFGLALALALALDATQGLVETALRLDIEGGHVVEIQAGQERELHLLSMLHESRSKFPPIPLLHVRYSPSIPPTTVAGTDLAHLPMHPPPHVLY